jgi:YHS domain-containing protein
MLRAALLLVLVVLVARAFWKVLDGVLDGARGGAPRQVPTAAPPPGVPMARDPVCGTYVVPERAITLASGGQQIFFCSARCRDAFRARTA